MNSKQVTRLSVFLLAFLAGNAQATDFFCDNYVASNPPAHFQCVQTAVGPGTPKISSPDEAGAGARFASSSSADSGVFAATSSASAWASPGLLRGFASAQMLGGSIEGAQAIARSAAWFADGGTVVGAVGVPIGTPVTLRFTISVNGGFAGGGLFNPESEATGELVARGPRASFIDLISHVDKFTPFRIVTADVNAFVGETFEMLVKLDVQAGAINNIDVGNAMSVADVSNSGHVFVDVLSANASFIGSSGYLYATLAPVPEPSEYAMLLSGFVFIAALTRRRLPRKELGWVSWGSPERGHSPSDGRASDSPMSSTILATIPQEACAPTRMASGRRATSSLASPDSVSGFPNAGSVRNSVCEAL